MDEKTTKYGLNSIESLRKDQKVLANKLIELNGAVRSSIEKIRKNKIDDSAAFEARINDLKVLLNSHSDSITDLENQKTNLNEMMKQIDANIDNINDKIHESINKIETLENNENEVEIKQCIYDRKGYCKMEDKCSYYHSEEICPDYIEKNICTEKQCRK